MFQRIVRLYRERRRRRALVNLRAVFALYGLPADGMTDAELVAGLASAQQRIARVGFTVEEVDRALAMMSSV